MTFDELVKNPALAINEGNEALARAPKPTPKPKRHPTQTIEHAQEVDALYPDPVSFEEMVGNPRAALRVANAKRERERVRRFGKA